MARGNQGARTRLTPKRRKKFVEALAEMGNVQYACDKVGCARTSVYDCKKRDPEFAAEWEKAIEASADKLEQEAWRRAHEGVKEPVFHKGEVCGVVKKYSDVLLIFLLKGLRPEKYRERVDATGHHRVDVTNWTSLVKSCGDDGGSNADNDGKTKSR